MIIVYNGKKYQTHHFLGILNRYQCYSLFEITPYQKIYTDLILGIWGTQKIIANRAFFSEQHNDAKYHEISIEEGLY